MTLRISPLMFRGFVIVVASFAASWFLATLNVSLYYEFAKHSFQSMQTLASWGTFSATGLIICLGIAIYQARGWKDAVLLEHERHVLDFAKTQTGSVLLGDVVMHCPVRAAHVSKTLDRLIASGICDSNIDEQGRVFYTFASSNNVQIESKAIADTITSA